MVKLGRVSRSGFYRFQGPYRVRIATWICVTRFSGSHLRPWGKILG